MPREGQCVRVHFLHRNGKHPRGLGNIRHKADSVLLCPLPRLGGRQHGAANIGSMCHNQQPGIGPLQGLNARKGQAAIRVGQGSVKLHARAFELVEGAHHRVVLHRGGEHMISRL